MSDKKRVLITGIAGMIGSNLSRALLDRGYIVDGIDDLSVGNDDYIDHRVGQFIRTKVTELQLEAIVGLVGPYDFIIHLSTKKIPRYGGAEEVLWSNTNSMIRVLYLAEHYKAKIIFASTSDIYGKQTEFHEQADSVLGPTDISRWSYAISKLWCEQMLYAQTEVDFNIIRYFGSYGPYMSLTWTAGPPSVFIGQALKCEPLTVHGTGKQTRCFSHIDDHVDGTIRLMESGFNREVFNIGNPNEEISMEDFALRVIDLVHDELGAELDERIFEEEDIVYVPYTNLKYEDVMRRVPNIGKAQVLLGYQPKISLDEGLRRTIEWQRKEMGL